MNNLPEELSSTFEKMIQQLDIISKTMKIMDQRIATVENQVTEIFDIHKQNKRDYYKSLPKTYTANDFMYKNNVNENNYEKENLRNENFESQKNQIYQQSNYNNNMDNSNRKVIFLT